MTTWSDIQTHMRERFTLEDDTDDMLSMVWSYDDGRTQKIIVRRFRAFDRDMVEFKSPFARATDVDPEQVLRENAALPLATVALSGTREEPLKVKSMSQGKKRNRPSEGRW